MKYFFSIFLSLVIFNVTAQKDDDIYFSNNSAEILSRDQWKMIPPGTNTITVETGLSAAENWKMIREKLVEAGYTFEKEDRELNYFTTALKPIKRNMVHQLTVKVNDETISFRGLFNSNLSIYIGSRGSGVVSESNMTIIEKRGARESLYGIAFASLFRASTLAGHTRVYEQK